MTWLFRLFGSLVEVSDYEPICHLQQARKERTEALPHHEWALKREALLASGLVDERRQLREQNA